MTCPSCGSRLVAVLARPDSAPWLCEVCRRGFFVAELSREAVAAWRLPEHDHGFGEVARMVRRDVKGEVAAAYVRGVCVRGDMLAGLPVGLLEALVGVWAARLSPAFLAEVRKAAG